MILKSFLSLKIDIEIWRAEAVCHAFYCFVCFFLLLCDLVCATTRNPGYTNWVLHLWLASCWQTRHTLVFASMFLTTTTLEAEECRNYTGCCQPQQVGITSSFFFSFWRERSHSYIFKSLSEMQEIKNRGFLVNSHCCCLSSDVFVHIDTYTAETGVSRFLQLNKNWRLVFYFDLKSVHQSFFFFLYTVLNFLFFCVCFELSLEFRKKFGLTSVFSICIVSFSFFQIL